MSGYPISRYMTRQPWTIRMDATLAEARALMREHGIRHLPVLDAGRLRGPRVRPPRGHAGAALARALWRDRARSWCHPRAAPHSHEPRRCDDVRRARSGHRPGPRHRQLDTDEANAANRAPPLLVI